MPQSAIVLFKPELQFIKGRNRFIVSMPQSAIVLFKRRMVDNPRGALDVSMPQSAIVLFKP